MMDIVLDHSDSDSDASSSSSTSSTSDETLSSSSSSSSSDGDRQAHRVLDAETAKEKEEDDKTPRRVRKARETTLTCLEATFAILAESRRGNDIQTHDVARKGRPIHRQGRSGGKEADAEGWDVLANGVERAAKECSEDKVVGTRGIRECLAILDHFARHWLLPLTHDKEYLSSLNKGGARAMRAFTKCWMALQGSQAIPSSLDILSDQQTALLDYTPPALLARIARHALSPRMARLDLSHLHSPYRSGVQLLEQADMPLLLRTFGSSPSQITHLDVSSNDLARFPRWFPFPFSSLATLNVASNPRLTSLPLPLILLPQLRVLHTHKTALSPRSHSLPSLSTWHQGALPIQQPVTEARRGVPSLVHMAILRLPRLDLSLDLPPHLQVRVDGAYRCEMCGCGCVPGDQGSWRAHEGRARWYIHSPTVKWVRVRGRVCKRCWRGVQSRAGKHA